MTTPRLAFDAILNQFLPQVTDGDTVAYEHIDRRGRWRWSLGIVLDQPVPRITRVQVWRRRDKELNKEERLRSEALTRDIDARVAEVESKKKEAEESAVRVAANRTILLRQKAAAEERVEHGRRRMEEAKEALLHIDDATLRELRSYRTPPPMVKMVLEAVLFILSAEAPTDGRRPEVAWETVQAAMRERDFIQRVAFFNPLDLTVPMRDFVASEYASDKRFTFEIASKASRAAGPMQLWVSAQLACSVAAEEQRVVEEQMTLLLDEMEEAQRAQDAFKARVAALEKEIEQLRFQQEDLLDDDEADTTVGEDDDGADGDFAKACKAEWCETAATTLILTTSILSNLERQVAPSGMITARTMRINPNRAFNIDRVLATSRGTARNGGSAAAMVGASLPAGFRLAAPPVAGNGAAGGNCGESTAETRLKKKLKEAEAEIEELRNQLLANTTNSDRLDSTAAGTTMGDALALGEENILLRAELEEAQQKLQNAEEASAKALQQLEIQATKMAALEAARSALEVSHRDNLVIIAELRARLQRIAAETTEEPRATLDRTDGEVRAGAAAHEGGVLEGFEAGSGTFFDDEDPRQSAAKRRSRNAAGRNTGASAMSSHGPINDNDDHHGGGARPTGHMDTTMVLLSLLVVLGAALPAHMPSALATSSRSLVDARRLFSPLEMATTYGARGAALLVASAVLAATAPLLLRASVASPRSVPLAVVLVGLICAIAAGITAVHDVLAAFAVLVAVGEVLTAAGATLLMAHAGLPLAASAGFAVAVAAVAAPLIVYWSVPAVGASTGLTPHEQLYAAVVVPVLAVCAAFAAVLGSDDRSPFPRSLAPFTVGEELRSAGAQNIARVAALGVSVGTVLAVAQVIAGGTWPAGTPHWLGPNMSVVAAVASAVAIGSTLVVCRLLRLISEHVQSVATLATVGTALASSALLAATAFLLNAQLVPLAALCGGSAIGLAAAGPLLLFFGPAVGLPQCRQTNSFCGGAVSATPNGAAALALIFGLAAAAADILVAPSLVLHDRGNATGAALVLLVGPAAALLCTVLCVACPASQRVEVADERAPLLP